MFILVMGCNAELTQREQLPTGQAAPALAAKAAPGGRPLRAAISGLPRGPPPIRRAPCLPWSLDPATFQPHLRWGEAERRGVSWGPRRDRGQGPGPGRVVAGWGCLLGSVAFTGCPCWPAEPGQGGVTPTVQRSRSGPAPPHGTEGCSGGGGGRAGRPGARAGLTASGPAAPAAGRSPCTRRSPRCTPAAHQSRGPGRHGGLRAAPSHPPVPALLRDPGPQDEGCVGRLTLTRT